LRDLGAARFEGVRCRCEHDPGRRLSCRTGGISGHGPDFLCAVLCGSDDCLARLRRHGSDHCSCPPLEFLWVNCRWRGRFPDIASGLCDRRVRIALRRSVDTHQRGEWILRDVLPARNAAVRSVGGCRPLLPV
jgi:hypothetical protein